MAGNVLATWKARAKKCKTEIFALYLAFRRPDTPWYAKVALALVLAYALSPIDLIPDFIPVLGYLDDLLLLPIGIYLVIKLIPPYIMTDCRAQAWKRVDDPEFKRAGLIIVGSLWIVCIALILLVIFR